MSQTVADAMLGRLVDGRYVVRERVASGGMATVYVAFDKRLEREVALKVMNHRWSTEPEGRDFVHRFRREAKAAARLTHPGMVRVYDQGVDGDISYLTMEYVRGRTLRQRLGSEATLPVNEALAITESVLDALAAAHRQGLVHRDIKPENVLLDADGRPRVTDFGLTRAVTDSSSTATGTIMGTVAYLGPELVSRGQSDARTDVYSMGILLYEMVTGRQPFTGDSAIDIASRHVHEDVPPPSTHVPWLPPEFDALVGSLVARDPAARPRDAAAALSMLRQTRAMMDDPTMARRADPPSGAIRVINANDDTTVFAAVSHGSTVALPIGLGEPIASLTSVDADIIDDDPEAHDPLPAQHHALWWIAATTAAIIFLAVLGLWWYNSSGPGAYTTVPPVVGNTEAAALAILSSAGLEGVIERVHHDEVPAGIVIGTRPNEQSRVANASGVAVVASLGPRMETVPDLVGGMEFDARQIIRDAGFAVGDVTYIYSDTIPQGEVTATTPTAGERVRHNAAIALIVSGGPEPIVIPNVVGSTEETAVALLTVYAIEVTVIYERTNEDVDKGRVFRQDPQGGSEGFRTQSATIYVSDGPPLITVPDYTGVSGDEATQRAKELGLKVERGRLPGRSKDAAVLYQYPSPGTQVEKGSTLVLYY